MFVHICVVLLHLLLHPMLHLSNYSLSIIFTEKKNGSGIVYVQVLVNRKRLLKTTGINCRKENFIKGAADFKYISRKDPQHEYKNQQIRMAYNDAEKSLLEVIRLYGNLNIDLAKIAIDNKYSKIDTLAEYAQRYIDTKPLAENTKKRYGAILRTNILPEYKNTGIVEITPKWLGLFHQKLIKDGYEGTSIWTIFKFIKSALNLAADSIEFPFPIGSKKGQYKMPPYKNPERHFLSLEQIEKIKEYHNSTDTTWRNASRWFVLQIYLGCRAGDLQNYSKHQIKDGRYYLTDEKTENPHYIPMYPKLQEAIDNIERPISSYDKYNKAVKAIGRDMGLPFELTTHVARHTFAVSKLNAGVSTETTMKTMGIKKHSTFAVYGKITDAKIDREFGEKMN